jgi:hypothetical protein
MKTVLFLFLSCCASTTCLAQGYMPVGKPKSAPAGRIHAFALGLPSGALTQCNTTDIPNWSQLKTKKFETHIQIMTASQAASLNISLAGVTTSGSSDQLLAISDTSRVAPCLATDGKTTVYYGEAIRTVVAMNDYTVKGGASIAIVAATATADGKTNSVDLYEVGFGDLALDQKLVAAKQTLGGSGINIDDYSDFIKAYNAAESYAQTLTNPGIDIVGFDNPYSLGNYSDILATAWAIQYIAQGNGCQDAIKDFKQQDQQYQNDIRSTYDGIAGGCGVDGVGRAKAQQLLNGLKIRY